jgi:WXG100 family type VII secretion target
MYREIAVNTSTLASDIETLQEQLDMVKKDINDMYGAVQTLDSMWDGPANEAFKTQFRQDYKDMQELCKTVQQIIKCMKYAKKEYNVCENEVNDIVASIQI